MKFHHFSLFQFTFLHLPFLSSAGLISRAMPHDRDSPHLHHIRGSISQGQHDLRNTGHSLDWPPLACGVHCLTLSLSGIPRDDCQRREVKQMKREGSPSPRGPGHPSDSLKSRSHESMVPTVKEAGRSIHLIPPEGVVIGKPKEGSITQVTLFFFCLLWWKISQINLNMVQFWKYDTFIAMFISY